MIGDEHLPLVLGQPTLAGAQDAVFADVAFAAGAPEGVGAGVGGVGEHVVHGMVGGLDPGEFTAVAGDVADGLQRQLQALVAQPQPHATHRAGLGETFEDRGEHADNGLVGVQQDLAVGLAPDQPDGQAAAQLAAGGLVADAAVEAGAQGVQLSFADCALEAEEDAVVERPRMVDTVGVGDQRVGDAGEVQQPVPVGVVARQPGALQGQHDADLAQADLGGQLGEAGAARRRRAACAEVVVDHAHAAARPAQRHGAVDEVVLAGGGLGVALHLGECGLADIHDRVAAQMRRADLGVLTHRRPPRLRPRRSWR